MEAMKEARNWRKIPGRADAGVTISDRNAGALEAEEIKARQPPRH